MRNHIQRRTAGRVVSKSFPWFWLLIPSVFLGLSAAGLSSGQILTSLSSSGSRTVEGQAGGATRRASGADTSLVLSMRRPIGFEPNRGQTIQRFKFLGRGDGYNLFIGEREAVLSLDRGGAKPAGPGVRDAALRNLQAREARSARKVIGIKLVGARAGSTIEAKSNCRARSII